MHNSLICRLALIMALMLAVSCATPPVSTEKYHGSNTAIRAATAPVAQLQGFARNALKARKYQQAIGYLQRAIKIEPRNATSWHYLAQSYWHTGNSQKCLDMIDRSYGYSVKTDGLDLANARLKQQCEAD